MENPEDERRMRRGCQGSVRGTVSKATGRVAQRMRIGSARWIARALSAQPLRSGSLTIIAIYTLVLLLAYCYQ